MRSVCWFIILLWIVVLPASALEIQAPDVPEMGQKWMPEDTKSFGQGLQELLQNNLAELSPDFSHAMQICIKVICIILMVSVLENFTGQAKHLCNLAGIVSISTVLLLHTNSMVTLGVETVSEICDYAALLLPVMTGAMAAQGGVTTSASLYAGTAIFNAVLANGIRILIIPGLYLYIAVAVIHCATQDKTMKKLADHIKDAIGWILKILLIVFTTYISITGVVSGNTDAAALKATKVSISSFVPVVGGILSDASEAVLVSVGLLKNAAGIYGILAVLSVFLHPFFQIAVHYLVLKMTGIICSIIGNKSGCDLLESFSAVMGFLLGITASCCMIVLISTVCFMRGVSG